jgi:hypothetical protein
MTPATAAEVLPVSRKFVFVAICIGALIYHLAAPYVLRDVPPFNFKAYLDDCFSGGLALFIHYRANRRES